MSKVKDNRKRNERLAEFEKRYPTICDHCGKEGNHFVPPGSGTSGFWACP